MGCSNSTHVHLKSVRSEIPNERIQHPMEKFVEKELISKTGAISTTDALRGKKIIGLYFSGSYCPSCIEFTPKLISLYNMIHMDLKSTEFEIIFISTDHDTEKFTEYYDKMPWLSLPWEKHHVKSKLFETFGIETVPTLIFFNEKGEVYEREGRTLAELHVSE